MISSLRHHPYRLVRNLSKQISAMSSSVGGGMPMNLILSQLKDYAPLHLADQSWDNVGLLVEPVDDNPTVHTILFTNDLTEPVLDEAIERQCQLIVSYHPPIFSALKRLTQANWKERIVLKCIRHGIAVYSPHTSWDALENGVNQWLASAFGTNGEDFNSRPIESVKLNETPSKNQQLLTMTVPVEQKNEMIKNLNEVTVINEIACDTVNGPAMQISLACSTRAAATIVEMYRDDANIAKTIQIIDVQKPLDSRQGYGRLLELKESRSIRELVQNVKTLTGLKHIRLALANNKSMDSLVKTIALCAGSGSSVFSGARNVDMQLTGELSHHAVLDAVHRGTTVILCEHSNTERGFLAVVKQHFDKLWGSDRVKLFIAERDRDPLEIV